MPTYKHVGRVKSNQRKVVVAYRVIPGDPESALVVQTENLNADEHDALIKLVESDAGQQAYEFAEAMARARLPDGRNMLAGFHTTGKLSKVPAELIEMMPNRATVINLKKVLLLLTWLLKELTEKVLLLRQRWSLLRRLMLLAYIILQKLLLRQQMVY